MSIDSKSANSLSSNGVVEHAASPSSADMEMRANVIASFTRLTLFLSVLVFCIWCGYGYAAALFYGKDSTPSAWVGFVFMILAAMEMSMADYAEKLPFCYAGEEPTIPYSFFVIGAFVTTCSLFLYDQQIAGAVALHLMAFFAVITTILGATIIWSCIIEAGEKLVDIVEKLW